MFVDLAKQNGLHMVGIQGADIVDAKKTLVLGLVWQLMRYVLPLIPINCLVLNDLG